ncbi:MAG: MerR family transcriptional regulator [Desulfuromonadales bacterium]|nr:MerR family transcriptional regulator [Desulfuromonadales bacterium]
MVDLHIPDKLYFKIGEVAELASVKPYVLRYWETEFSAFRPSKSRSQQRLYTRKDIELILHLKDLLYQQGFTIAGARKKLREESRKKSVAASFIEVDSADEQMALPLVPGYDRKLLTEIIHELTALRDSLDNSLPANKS